MTALDILRMVVGLLGAALTIVYWIVVGGRGHEAFRRRCERYFRVIITTNGTGYWAVRGDSPWYRNLAIEWLQLGFFLVLYLGWAALMIATVLLGKLLSTWFG